MMTTSDKISFLDIAPCFTDINRKPKLRPRITRVHVGRSRYQKKSDTIGMRKNQVRWNQNVYNINHWFKCCKERTDESQPTSSPKRNKNSSKWIKTIFSKNGTFCSIKKLIFRKPIFKKSALEKMFLLKLTFENFIRNVAQRERFFQEN